MNKRFKKNIKGVTLLVLVITIIVLLILAAVVANLALSDGGILDEARKAAKEWNETTDEEQSRLSKLAQEMRNARNGIYNGTDSSSGNETGGNEGEEDKNKDEQIADLENTVSNLEGTIDELNKQLEQEKSNKQELENRITDLNNRVDELEKEVEQGKATIAEKQGEIDNLNTELLAKNEELENKNNTITSLEGTVASLNKQIENLNTQIANLTKKQATGNATAGDVLATKTFSNASSVGLTGTMPNRGALNWSTNNSYYDIPAGYYSGGRIDSRPSYTAGYNAGYSGGQNSISTIKVNQSFFTDPGSWALTGNSWGSGTSEKLMTKVYTYPAGHTKYSAVIAVSSQSYARIRYINISNSTSKSMITPVAESTDSRGGYDARGVGAYIDGTLNPNGGTLTLSVSISRYSDKDMVVGLINIL